MNQQMLNMGMGAPARLASTGQGWTSLWRSAMNVLVVGVPVQVPGGGDLQGDGAVLLCDADGDREADRD